MDIKEANICRLCLKLAEKDFTIIDDTIKDAFKVLLLRVNFDISKDPIVCNDCRETSIKCLDFKSVCTVTEESILSFAANKNPATFTLKDVFNYLQDTEMVDDNFVCRFCLNRLGEDNYILLDTLTNDVTFVEQLRALLPAMDFDGIKNPVICKPCGQDLVCYVKFAENCLDVEKKVVNYYRNYGIVSSAQIKLSDVLQYSFKRVFESDNSQIHAIKGEKILLEGSSEAHVEAYDNKVIKEEVDLDVEEHGVSFDETVCETPSDMPPYELNISSELKSEAELGNTRKASSPSGFRTPPTTKCGARLCTTMHRCGIKCDKVSNTNSSVKYKGAVNKKNRLPSTKTKDVSEVVKFKCALCTYETNRKNSLKKHMLIHKGVTEVEMYKCTMCSYVTKHNSSLKMHNILIHKDDTEVEIYKCPECIFQTKQKGGLKRHMLIHKNIAEVQMYKCSTCTYVTKYKNGLKSHTLIHKDISDVELYKCSMCVYATRHKSSLKQHTLIHKDITEVQMYKCSTCTYVTKYKSSLKNHTLIHKDVNEVTTYKCSMCIYVTKHKGSLKQHTLIHKDVTEVDMYRCSVCAYETRHKADLKKHVLTHKQNDLKRRK